MRGADFDDGSLTMQSLASLRFRPKATIHHHHRWRDVPIAMSERGQRHSRAEKASRPTIAGL
jgi:hypothetical protein